MLNVVNVLYSQTIREDEKRERKPRHYPSSACALLDGRLVGKCRRATWYDWKGFERTDPMDAPALFKVNVGNLIHEHLSATLNRALLDLGYQEEGLSGEGAGDEVALVWHPEGLKYPFSSRMDKRLTSPDGLRLGMEWKSTYGRGADFIKRDGPKEDNLLQCALYLEQDVHPLDAIALVYAARDSGYAFGYWVTKHGDGLKVEHMGSTKVSFSPLGWPAIREGTLSLEAALESDAPPDCDYAERDWQCSYCPYAKLCRGEP